MADNSDHEKRTERKQIMKTPLIVALEGLLAATNVEPERAQRILAAAKDSAAEVAEEYWKTRQAAAALDIHPKSIWRYANRGLLNPVKRSARSTRWRKSEVMKLAAGI